MILPFNQQHTKLLALPLQFNATCASSSCRQGASSPPSVLAGVITLVHIGTPVITIRAPPPFSSKAYVVMDGEIFVFNHALLCSEDCKQTG